MSAFLFHTDAAGHVISGTAVTGALSDEAWRLTACPVRSLDECGVALVWPNGERWTWDHIAQELPPHHTDDKETA